MVDIDAEHAFEMTAVEDQQPIETLGTHSADEALRDRVRLRRSHRRLHNPDALAAEHLVEGTAVFAVPVTDQEPDALTREVEADVSRLLRDPSAGGIGCAAGEPDTTAAVGDEEQDVKPSQRRGLDGEEIASHDPCRLLTK